MARYLDIRPLFLAPARPMKVEWNIRPYLGVFPLVLRALRRRETEGEKRGRRRGLLAPSQNTEKDTAN